MLEVQAQLTSVRGQIEQLSAQLGDLEDRSSFATLSATFAAPVVAVEVAQKGWEPGVVVDEASASLPPDVAHLARRVADLSSEDRAELGRFAEYLRSRSTGGKA